MTRRLPPASAATLPSAFFSFLVHGGVVLTGLIAAPLAQPKSESTPMIVIPIELVTIADATNLTAVSAVVEDKPLADDVKSEANPAPGAPPPDEDAVSFDEMKEKLKDLPKKPQAAPTPPSKSFSQEMEDILKNIPKSNPAPRKNDTGAAPPSSSKEPERLSVGDRRQMTASVEDAIRSQLIAKGCFADHSDMADARRLRVTLRVWFGRNGKFSQAYQLVSPAREPSNDQPLQVFLTHARRALDMCNNLGWQVPPDYFRLPQPQYIDIVFLPKIGADP